MGKPLQAAQEALKAHKFKDALADLQTAAAFPNKTAYENYVISALQASAYVQLQDYPNGIKALEALIASGQLPANEIAPREQAIAEMAYQTKDFATFNEYVAKYYKDGGTDEKLHQLSVQSYFVQGDYATASKMLRASVAAQEKNGGKPSKIRSRCG